MGEIVRTRVCEGKVVYYIELSEEEALQLKNHVTKVHLFTEDLCSHDTRIIQRGNKGGAKYFSIPLSLKSRKKKKYNQASYQKIEVGDKVFFVCVVDKDLLY